MDLFNSLLFVGFWLTVKKRNSQNHQKTQNTILLLSNYFSTTKEWKIHLGLKSHCCVSLLCESFWVTKCPVNSMVSFFSNFQLAKYKHKSVMNWSVHFTQLTQFHKPIKITFREMKKIKVMWHLKTFPFLHWANRKSTKLTKILIALNVFWGQLLLVYEASASQGNTKCQKEQVLSSKMFTTTPPPFNQIVCVWKSFRKTWTW